MIIIQNFIDVILKMVYNSDFPYQRYSTDFSLSMFGILSGPRKYGPYVFEQLRENHICMVGFRVRKESRLGN